MANMTIEIPDDFARRLIGIVEAQDKSVQPRPGSAAAVLRAMKEPPHLSEADVDALDAAIAAGRLPVESGRLFQD
jgi:predicted transcriptional regulator